MDFTFAPKFAVVYSEFFFLFCFVSEGVQI